MLILKSAFLFIIAGICEIWGGYLLWLWFRESKALLIGVLGGFILCLYGVVPTFEPVHFGRVYSAYGGVLLFYPYLGVGLFTTIDPINLTYLVDQFVS